MVAPRSATKWKTDLTVVDMNHEEAVMIIIFGLTNLGMEMTCSNLGVATQYEM